MLTAGSWMQDKQSREWMESRSCCFSEGSSLDEFGGKGPEEMRRQGCGYWRLGGQTCGVGELHGRGWSGSWLNGWVEKKVAPEVEQLEKGVEGAQEFWQGEQTLCLCLKQDPLEGLEAGMTESRISMGSPIWGGRKSRDTISTERP